MAKNDNDAIQWCEDHPDELRIRASTVFREYIERERAAQIRGEKNSSESWHWEDAIAEILKRPASSALVKSTSELLREKTKPWKLERCDDAETFDRLLDKFESALSDAGPGR